MSSGRKSLFNNDVQLEDVDPDPFGRFGGEQVMRTPGSDPTAIVRPNQSAAAASSPRAAAQAAARNPMLAPQPPAAAAAAAAAGNGKRSIFELADLNTKPPGTTATSRRVMMINTELGVGHEKTLKNTLGRKTTVNSLNGKTTSSLNASATSLHRSHGSEDATPMSNASRKSGNGASSPTSGGDMGLSAIELMEGNQNRLQIPRISTLKRIPKAKKGWLRINRTAYQFGTMFCVIVAFGISAALMNSGYWVVRKDTLNRVDRWEEITTFAGPCACATNLEFPCNTLNNAFNQVSQMSGILVGSELLLIGILLFEFSFYGIFGGPSYFTRLTLIAEVLGFATAILSLILYVMAFQTPYCDVQAFEADGFVLGWSAYLRGLEALGFFVMIVLTADAGFDSSRGPPCTLLFVGSVLFAATCISTTSYGWMTQGKNRVYGITSHCDCGSTCSTRTDLGDLLVSTQGLTIFQTLLALITIFFALLRGVDNVGATLKFAEISGTVFVGVAIANIANLYRLNFDLSCNIPGQEDVYVPSWGMYGTACAAGIMCIFLALNGLYMTRFFVAQIEETIIENLSPDHPFYEWAENRKTMRETQAQLHPSVANATSTYVRGVASPPPRGGGNNNSASSPLGTVPVATKMDDEERYKSGPFACVGPRTFYQVFWWDELMSDGAIHAEELEDALEDGDGDGAGGGHSRHNTNGVRDGMDGNDSSSTDTPKSSDGTAARKANKGKPFGQASNTAQYVVVEDLE